MARAQCIVYRNNRLLMVKHRLDGVEWWCLPGGRIETGETPAEAALRELQEECCVDGGLVRQTAHMLFEHESGTPDEAHSFWVDIGEQTPALGHDPDVPADQQVLVDIAWLTLAEMPERDRAFVWAAGLLGLPGILDLVETWGDAISYPV